MTSKEEFVTFILNNYDKLNWIKMAENDAQEVYTYATYAPSVSDSKYILQVGGTRLSTYLSLSTRNPDNDTLESFEINEVQDERTSRVFNLVHNKVKNDVTDNFFRKAIVEFSKSIGEYV